MGEPDTVALTRADWRYKRADIHWTRGVVSEMTDDELAEAFVHELVHVMVNEIGTSDDHEERVCTEIARAFMSIAGGEKFLPTVKIFDALAASQ